MTSCTRLSGTLAPDDKARFSIPSKKLSGISSGASIRREGIQALSHIRHNFAELLEFFEPTMMSASDSFTASFTAS
jgi:hypothetical protein